MWCVISYQRCDCESGSLTGGALGGQDDADWLLIDAVITMGSLLIVLVGGMLGVLIATCENAGLL